MPHLCPIWRKVYRDDPFPVKINHAHSIALDDITDSLPTRCTSSTRELSYVKTVLTYLSIPFIRVSDLVE